jgi:hypothetical protein
MGFNLLNYFFMARIDSEAVGRGRGSTGNVTYRYTRGKTIMSRRITTNKSKTVPQVKQRKGFGTVAHLAKAIRPVLDIGFAKHKDGRGDNLFMHYNTSLMEYIKDNPDFDAHLPSVTNLCIALSHRDFTGKIMVADGDITLATGFDWGPDSTIGGMVHSSRKFVEGDKVSLGLCYSYLLSGSFFEMVEVYTRQLTEEDVRKLSFKSHLAISKELFPEMDVFGILPVGFSDVEILVTFILVGAKDASESFLVPMPDMAPEFHVASQTFDSATRMRLVMENPAAFVAEVGGRALGLSLVFMDNMESGNPRLYKVVEMATDTEGKVNGIVVASPTGFEYDVRDYVAEADEYSGLLKDNRFIVTFTGVAWPDLTN